MPDINEFYSKQISWKNLWQRNDIIIIIIISFMQGIYIHIPETNYVPREYSVAATLLFLFMVLISLVSVLNLLYFYNSTFRSMCAVTNMAVFCSSLTYYYYYYYYKVKVKRKQSLYTPITGPEGSRRIRPPDFETIGTWKCEDCRSYAPASFNPPPRKYFFYSFLSEARQTPGP